MRKVAPYWSQKGLIATYYQTRRSPDEQPAAPGRCTGAARPSTPRTRSTRGRPRSAPCSTGRRRRSPEGLDRPPPRPARLLPLRAPPAERGSARICPPRRAPSFQIVDEQQQQVLPGPGGSLTLRIAVDVGRARRHGGRGSSSWGASSRRRGRAARCWRPSSTAASFCPSCCWPTSAGWRRWPPIRTCGARSRPRSSPRRSGRRRWGRATSPISSAGCASCAAHEILRLGARELGWGTTEEVARELSAFADVCLDVAVAFCDAALTRELGPAARRQRRPGAASW